jgi:ABC-2 type transport system ATP-binding protein
MESFIRISGLTRKFEDFVAVDHLNLEIRQGEIFGLLGPNGAGKTTTINMICGLLRPTMGLVKFEGFGSNDRKQLIGYCPQENIFYPKLTCLEQLVFVGVNYGMRASVARKNALQLLAELGLTDKIHKTAAGLSGGMKRRLNIALAIIHSPEILILDEPEAGLDPQSRILVRDFIRDFGKKKTIILTTHNMDEADRLADRIAIMDFGKLLLLDTPENIKRSVGEGDILEILVNHTQESHISDFLQKVSAFVQVMKPGPDHFLFKEMNVLQYLPQIKREAEKSGLHIAEFKLRENTLEDAFIHLTGRNLRQ